MSDISSLINKTWDEIKSEFRDEDHDSIKHILKRISEETSRLLIPSEKESALINLKHLVNSLEAYTIKYKIKSLTLARRFVSQLMTKIIEVYL